MSNMEPDEGAGTDAPRWEKTEAANAADAPRWERADEVAADSADADSDDDDSDDSTDS